MKIENIVVATDLSLASDASLALAVSFGRIFGARITVINVEEEGTFDLPESPRLDRALREARQGRRAALAEYQEMLEEAGLEFKIRAEVGQPVERILKTLAGTGADLLIVGRRGVRRLPGQRLGKTTRRLLRRIKVPTIVVPGKNREADSAPVFPRLRGGLFLAPTKLSPHCNMALRATCSLAERFNGTVESLHVLRLPALLGITDADWPSILPDDTFSSMDHTLADNLAEIVGADWAAMCKPISTIGTSVAETVAEVIADEGAALCVVPSRGRPDISFGVLGSTTLNILRLSPVPVLVLPVEYLELNHARDEDLKALEE